MATAGLLGWAGAVCLVTLLFVSIGQSAIPSIPSDVGLGEPCKDDHACKTPNSYCQQRTCACKSGYKPTSKNDSCFLPSELGETCSRADDCAYTHEASRCADNVCKRCSEGSEKEFSKCTNQVGGCAYHEYDGVCFPYRRIGEFCDSNEDCWIYPGSNRTRQCVLSECVCVETHDTMSGPLPDGQIDQCIQKQSSSAKCSMSASLSLILLLAFIMNNM